MIHGSLVYLSAPEWVILKVDRPDWKIIDYASGI